MVGEHVSRAHAGTRHVSHGEHAPLSHSASCSLPRSLTPAFRFSLSLSLFPSLFAIFLVPSCSSSSSTFSFLYQAQCVLRSRLLATILYLPPSSFPADKQSATMSSFISLLYLAVFSRNESSLVSLSRPSFCLDLTRDTRTHGRFCFLFLSRFLFPLTVLPLSAQSSPSPFSSLLPRTVSSYASYSSRLTRAFTLTTYLDIPRVKYFSPIRIYCTGSRSTAICRERCTDISPGRNDRRYTFAAS